MKYIIRIEREEFLNLNDEIQYKKFRINKKYMSILKNELAGLCLHTYDNDEAEMISDCRNFVHFQL